MSHVLSVADQLAIQNLLSRYALLMDAGDEAWAFMFTEEGVLRGVTPEPVVGRENLRKVPVGAYARNGGRVKHHNNNILIEAGDTPDTARLRAYALVSEWKGEGGKLLMMVEYDMHLVLLADGWRIGSANLAITK